MKWLAGQFDISYAQTFPDRIQAVEIIPAAVFDIRLPSDSMEVISIMHDIRLAMRSHSRSRKADEFRCRVTTILRSTPSQKAALRWLAKEAGESEAAVLRRLIERETESRRRAQHDAELQRCSPDDPVEKRVQLQRIQALVMGVCQQRLDEIDAFLESGVMPRTLPPPDGFPLPHEIRR